MSCTLEVSARERSFATDPGRWVQVVRGASVIWSGKMDEPQASDAGWQIVAHGSGTFGADFAAVYTGAWVPSVVDDVINASIALSPGGLNWKNPGIGNPPGLWLGQAVDSGSQQIDALLNLVCTKGGLTWYVACRPSGNILSVFPLPTTVTNLLVSNTPVSRTLGGDTNVIWLRFQDRADSTTAPAEYTTTSVTEPASIAVHGRMETFADLSNSNVLTVPQAQAVGRLILNRYQRASFAQPFLVGPGQLLTTGGSPIDLGAGMPYAPMVCRLILTDYGYGGEISPQPVTFLVGGYEFDDDSQTAQVTPFQNLRTSFSGLLSMVVSTLPARKPGT